jgi:hypothetical protein
MQRKMFKGSRTLGKRKRPEKADLDMHVTMTIMKSVVHQCFLFALHTTFLVRLTLLEFLLCSLGIISKKRHHHAKLIHKAIKKAKQFEIRKIVRRLKQANNSKGDDPVAKLETQLGAARAADVEDLAQYALKRVEDALQCTPSEHSKNPHEESMQVLVNRRILTAKCVEDEIQNTVQTLQNLREKAEKSQKLVNSSLQPNVAASQGTSAGSDDQNSEPDDEAKEALAKLLRHKGADAPENNGSSGLTSGTSSASSLDEDDLLVDAGQYLNGNLDGVEWHNDNDASQGREEFSRQASGDLKQKDDSREKGTDMNETSKLKRQKTAKPQKSKNRLGQRARRRLAEQEHGMKAAHLPASVQEKRPRNQVKNPSEEILHPSWAARRQQKANQSLPISAPAAATKKVAVGNVGIEKGFSSSGPQFGKLHPSWELKRKQAEAQRHLQPPQGKKIVFGDDD